MNRGIKIEYIYSACVVISTPNARILCDPWFTEGIYDGSWFHFPKVNRPVKRIGECDAIYVSHIHPDHYDAAFIKEYFGVYGKKPIYIADHAVNHLHGKMRADGLSAMVLDRPCQIHDAEITIFPHVTGSISDIDSALIVRYHDGARQHCAVNVNDIGFDEPVTQTLRELCPEVDILLLGYTGAGPYPQTYFDPDDPMLVVEAEHKKQAFFARYRRTVEALNPKVTIPFAGKYLLGGKLAGLNHLRGVADATEVLAFDARAVVLADECGYIDTVDFQPSKVRNAPYDPDVIETYLRLIASRQFDYDRLMNADEVYQLPLKRLLAMAAINAKAKSEVNEDYFFTFRLPGGEVAVINANKNAQGAMKICNPQKLGQLMPRSEIAIDQRYLFGLLTHVYHWNNAEVGSQFMTRRHPPTHFNRSAQSFLNFLTL
ncbi:MAG: MBL fold metallo-hydrolase [Deltaproteobacteria bacterium]|nr:MBL fold metallo-hydrolase [Deltaproteobacteria bacterium]